MDAEQVLKLYDSCWFELQIFRDYPSLSDTPSSSESPDLQVEEESTVPKFSPIHSIHTRSMSDQLSSMTSFKHDSLSPDSVLVLRKLKTILSGKEVTDTDVENPEQKHFEVLPTKNITSRRRSKRERKSLSDTRSMSDQLSSMTSFKHDSLSPDSVLVPRKLKTILSGKEVSDPEVENPEQKHFEALPTKTITSRRRNKRESKSLSDLEFEELRGFMDLGFVFSEEDKDSRLASIIPGLQRLGKKDEEGGDLDESVVPRPYLSEAWEVQDRRNEENPLTNWKVRALSNEIDIKDSLRWWAHTVASSIR